MNARERFNAVMHYQDRDRCPIMDFGFWEETPVVWREQGYPADANSDVFFGMDPQWTQAPVNASLCPPFEYKVIEDRGDTLLVIDGNGVTMEGSKFLGSIPKHIGHSLVGRDSWEELFLPRLNGFDEARRPSNWQDKLAEFLRPDREYPLGIDAGSLYGWLRNWMGMENLSMLVYDDPGLFEGMVETIADCIIESIRPWLDAGVKFDYAMIWEDMCYCSGPLLSPRVFKQVLVPQYKRITGLLRAHGCDVVVVDCDGEIDKLIPHWLEGGVNCMFPIEVGTWNGDPVRFRKEYGRDLIMMGGVGKRILASSPAEISREVDRLSDLVDEGGYIPTPDHRVPPDVSLANYAHYLREARCAWGKNLGNLRPMDKRIAR